ncbi:hypothetical protein Hypma_011012 [Hypsizygus marmoreus]|uniref:Uncharacterized protein n=1 Tax=Hypsizygus marmoreus TaxID=39966 RepID=A0A369JQ59_HYPMA|nr:hypothetical protein Hypma_011012 [Hypsizygus marmoreus]
MSEMLKKANQASSVERSENQKPNWIESKNLRIGKYGKQTAAQVRRSVRRQLPGGLVDVTLIRYRRFALASLSPLYARPRRTFPCAGYQAEPQKFNAAIQQS